MGHGSSDVCYERYYRSKTATIDWQRMARGLDAKSVLHLGSIMLGKDENAPSCLSADGLELAAQDPDYLRMNEAVTEKIDSILEKYQSLTTARTARDPLAVELEELVQNRNSRFRMVVRRLFHEERLSYFEKRDGVTLDRNGIYSRFETEDNIEDEVSAASASTAGTDWLEDLDAETLEVQDIDHKSGSEDDETSDRNPHKPANPTEIDEDATDAQVNAEIEDLDQGTDKLTSNKGTDVSKPDRESGVSTSDREHLKSCYRLHGVLTKNHRVRAGSDNTIVPCNLPYSDIWERIAGPDRENFDNASLAEYYLPFFAIDQPLVRWPAEWVPAPGSLTCKFCGEDHINQGYRSVWDCAKRYRNKEASDQFEDMLAEIQKTSSCQIWNMASKGQGSACHMTSTPAKIHAHQLTDHLRKMERSLSCHFRDCVSSTHEFDQIDELKEHFWVEHKWLGCRKSELCFWCPFCESYSFNQDRVTHLARHMDKARDMMWKHGYNGHMALSRTFVLMFNPFLFHNEALNAEQRLNISKLALYSGPTCGLRKRAQDIREHHLPAAGHRAHCPCAKASGTSFITCTYDDDMDATQLTEHLEKVHDVDLNPDSFPKQQRKPSEKSISGLSTVADQKVDTKLRSLEPNESEPENNDNGRNGQKPQPDKLPVKHKALKPDAVGTKAKTKARRQNKPMACKPTFMDRFLQQKNESVGHEDQMSADVDFKDNELSVGRTTYRSRHTIDDSEED